ncbi:type II secretion system inner membrane protein GspF [Paludibacterium yongneupense]|uniref:type II secretion system inner membrane protein GspF n=1 Tax=Paludibacterium yongneupense TaxID=400061 RepID=UPI00048D1F79|nr:type II secretion system inner membrane protein GspF [Paludibacterium yongneupense]
MASFRYLAQDAAGREVKGMGDADSARAMRAQLRERGLWPVEVKPVLAGGGQGGLRRGLSTAELVLLTRQLATLVSAGLPLERALAAVTEQSEQARTRQVLAALRDDILAGKSFAQALAGMPRVFGALYLALVEAGERSGHLDLVLARLADYLEYSQATRQKVLLALAYPAVVSLVALLVVSGLMTYVVPQVVGVFRDTHQTLPWLTRALMACSDFLRQWGLALLLGLLLSGAAARRVLARPGPRLRLHRRLLALPVLGRLLRALNTARMASTLAILVSSGVPLLTAMETARSLLGMVPMRDGLDEAMVRVREGSSLGRALGSSKQFPPVLIHLIGSGEASGTLATMLERAAAQQQQEVERRLATLTTLMEPLLILLMGGVVMVIVLAIMLPILDMNQMVR